MILSGKCKWASVIADRPNTQYEKQWRILLVVDEENKKAIEQMGLGGFVQAEISKGEPTGEEVITMYRKCETSTGKPRPAPVVLMRDGSPCTQDIGNGSLVRVQFRLDEWEYKNKSGVRLDLQGVLVEDLVVFGSDGAELAEFVDKTTDFAGEEGPF